MALESGAESAKKREAQAAVPPRRLPGEAHAKLSPSGGRSSLRVVIAAGSIGLLSLALWFATSSRGYDPKHRHPEMPDYAARFLMVSLKERNLLHDSKDYEPLAKAQQTSRELDEDYGRDHAAQSGVRIASS